MRRKRKGKEKKKEKGKRERKGKMKGGDSPQVALAMSDGRDYELSGVENRK